MVVSGIQVNKAITDQNHGKCRGAQMTDILYVGLTKKMIGNAMFVL